MEEKLREMLVEYGKKLVQSGLGIMIFPKE